MRVPRIQAPKARRRRVWVLALASIALVGCASSTTDEEQAARDVLRTNFNGWQVVSARDLTRDQFSSWSAEHPGRGPGFATGDFFGDKRKAYAALLTKKDVQGRRARLVVLGREPSGRYSTFILFSESPVTDMPVIYMSKAGEYQVYLGGQAVPVPNEGVVYSHGKGREKLFFWNVDRFQDIELTPEDTSAAN